MISASHVERPAWRRVHQREGDERDDEQDGDDPENPADSVAEHGSNLLAGYNTAPYLVVAS